MMSTKLRVEQVRSLIIDVVHTQPDEIGCDECAALLCAYAECCLLGSPASEWTVHVEQHLAQCPCCRQEFEALLVILRTTVEEL